MKQWHKATINRQYLVSTDMATLHYKRALPTEIARLCNALSSAHAQDK